GEPSYQYYLRSAKEAAQEATAAVQKAIDTLVEETLLNVELEAAEERASTISEIEMQALCGSSETCELPLASWRPTVPDDCASVPSGTAQVLCGSARQLIEETLGEVEIAEDVMANIQGVTPTFQDLAGSEFQRNLI